MPASTAHRAAVACIASLISAAALASSHREAPFITAFPKDDATDLFMFNSYESGKSDYVVLIADYYPLQEPGGGPNYFQMDKTARYEIKIDNNGDAVEDLTFIF